MKFSAIELYLICCIFLAIWLNHTHDLKDFCSIWNSGRQAKKKWPVGAENSLLKSSRKDSYDMQKKWFKLTSKDIRQTSGWQSRWFSCWSSLNDTLQISQNCWGSLILTSIQKLVKEIKKVLLWNTQNWEHQKYLWNVIFVLQGESQLGVRKLKGN